MKFILKLIIINLFILTNNLAFAETPVVTGIEPAGGFTCAAPNVILHFSGSKFISEEYKITDENNQSSSGSTTFSAPISIDGSLNKSLVLNNQSSDFSKSNFLGVYYSMTTESSYVNFFMIYDCKNKNVIDTCSKSGELCPQSVLKYYPNLSVSFTENSADVKLETYRDDIYLTDEYTDYIYYQNEGSKRLVIKNVELVENPDNEAKLISFKEGGIEVKVKAKKTGKKAYKLLITSNDPFKPVVYVTMSYVIKENPNFSLKINKIKLVKNGETTKIKGEVAVKNSGAKPQKNKINLSIGLYNTHSTDKLNCYDYAGSLNYTTTIASIALPKLRKGKTAVIKFESKALSNTLNSLSLGDTLKFTLKDNFPYNSHDIEQDYVLGGESKRGSDYCS